MTFFFINFGKKARVYYILSISRGGGARSRPPPGFATEDYISKSHSANLDKFVLLRTACWKFDEKTYVFSLKNYRILYNYNGFVLMLVLGTILSLRMGVLLVRICILINLNCYQGILI